MIIKKIYKQNDVKFFLGLIKNFNQNFNQNLLIFKIILNFFVKDCLYFLFPSKVFTNSVVLRETKFIGLWYFVNLVPQN